MKLSVRLFDQDERAYLAKVLELAGRRSRLPISQSAAAQADVIFLRDDEPGAQALLGNHENAQSRIVVVYGGDPACHRWTLGKPATSQELLPLLNSLHASLQGRTQPATSIPAGNDPANTGTPDDVPMASRLFPSRYGNLLLGRVLALQCAAQPWKCELGGELRLFADPQQGRLYADPILLLRPELLAEHAVRQNSPRLSTINADELAATRTLGSMPLETFCWLLALQAEACSDDDAGLLDHRFRLRRWPSFTQMRHSPAQITMTGRLVRQSLSIRELVADGRINLIEAIQLYNCASLCGLVEPDADHSPRTPRLPVQPARHFTTPELHPGLFGRILRRLAMLGEPQQV